MALDDLKEEEGKPQTPLIRDLSKVHETFPQNKPLKFLTLSHPRWLYFVTAEYPDLSRLSNSEPLQIWKYKSLPASEISFLAALKEFAIIAKKGDVQGVRKETRYLTFRQ